MTFIQKLMKRKIGNQAKDMHFQSLHHYVLKSLVNKNKLRTLKKKKNQKRNHFFSCQNHYQHGLTGSVNQDRPTLKNMININKIILHILIPHLLTFSASKLQHESSLSGTQFLQYGSGETIYSHNY